MQAYDSHCNLVLGEVEETIYVVDEDDEDEEVRVSGGARLSHFHQPSSNPFPVDNQSEIRNALRARCVLPLVVDTSSRHANDGLGDSVVLISPQVPS